MTVALTFRTSFLLARLGNGFRLFLDLGQLKPVDDDTGKENQTSKIIGDQIEYQFALGESFSFPLFGAEFGGKGALPDNTKYEYYKAGICVAELLGWMGTLFFGVHGGRYFLTWIESLSTFTGLK